MLLQVIKNPTHPYTQLLVDSIPKMRAAREWEQAGIDEAQNAKNETRQMHGCKFANRCKHVMEQCWSDAPPLYQVDDNRASACFLHSDAPLPESENIAHWMMSTSADSG